MGAGAHDRCSVRERARIVLLAADGESNRAIGDAVGMHYNQVAVWRRRYVEFGVEGLDDEALSGSPTGL